VTLTLELDPDRVKTNQRAKCLRTEVILFKSYYPETQTHTEPSYLPRPLKWSVKFHKTSVHRQCTHIIDRVFVTLDVNIRKYS